MAYRVRDSGVARRGGHRTLPPALRRGEPSFPLP
jgi:hypothetical protein